MEEVEIRRKRVYGRVTDVYYKIHDSMRPEYQNTIFTSSRGPDRAKVVRGVAYSYWKAQGAVFGPEGKRFGMIDYNRYSITTASDTYAIAHAIHYHKEEIEGEEYTVEKLPIVVGDVGEMLKLLTGRSNPSAETIAQNRCYIYDIEDIELLYTDTDYWAYNYALRIKEHDENGDLFILSYTDPNAPKNVRETFYWLKLTETEIEEATGMDANTFALNLQSSGLQWALEQLLEPEEVREARKKRIPFIRQGDLYFIETNKTTRSLKKRAIIYWKRIKEGKDWRGRVVYGYLPIIDPDEKGKEPELNIPRKPVDNGYYQFRTKLAEAIDLFENHRPRMFIITDDFGIYARGSVIHQNGDHKKINLGEKWHKVVQERFHDKVEKYTAGIGGSQVVD